MSSAITTPSKPCSKRMIGDGIAAGEDAATDARALHDVVDRHLAVAQPDGAWAALITAGVTGLTVPEALGGLGLATAAAAPVFAALGAHGASTPYLESAILTPVLLRYVGGDARDAILRALAGGAVVAIAGLDPRLRAAVSASPVGEGWRLDGDAALVLDGADADHLIVAARTERYTTALFAVPGGQQGLIAHRYPTIDGRRAADLRFLRVDAILLQDDADDLLGEAADIALACLATEAAALMRRLVNDTVDYTKQRDQFGQPIARFQVIQHRLVDMHIQTRRTAAIAARAMAALDGHWAERARLASAAKVTAADAGRFVGQNAVQLHGGMGMTRDLMANRGFRRLTVIEHELGSAAQHRGRYARMAAQVGQA